MYRLSTALKTLLLFLFHQETIMALGTIYQNFNCPALWGIYSPVEYLD